MRNVLSLARALGLVARARSGSLELEEEVHGLSTVLLGNEGGAAHWVKLFSGDPPAV
jgi:hypothetical protein